MRFSEEMADTLSIKGLAVECRIGVTDAERAKPQKIWIDLELAIDGRRAAAHDDVREAVDYAHLIDVVTRHVPHRTYRLMETFAEELATLLLQEFPIPEVTVHVTKRALPTIDSASVAITRRRVTGDDDDD